MASTITISHQTLDVDQVTDVVVTAIVQVSDQFVREVRVFGDPDGTAGPAILILRISADTEAKVKLTTPTLDF